MTTFTERFIKRMEPWNTGLVTKGGKTDLESWLTGSSQWLS